MVTPNGIPMPKNQRFPVTATLIALSLVGIGIAWSTLQRPLPTAIEHDSRTSSPS